MLTTRLRLIIKPTKKFLYGRTDGGKRNILKLL